MTDRLAALVKCVAKLHQARLEACHCVEEFHLRRICPSIVERPWHSNAHGWPISATILWRVISSSILYIINGKFALI
jgi:hypothetical protein